MRLIDVYDVPGAPRFLWDLMLERQDENSTNISFEMPTWEEHCDFFRARIFAFWFAIEVRDELVGYISLTHRNEIGVALFRKHRGHGYGPSAVKMLMEKSPPQAALPSERLGNFVANINPRNERSIRMFEKLGFRKIQETYVYDP